VVVLDAFRLVYPCLPSKQQAIPLLGPFGQE
jgi:hypothetical protein